MLLIQPFVVAWRKHHCHCYQTTRRLEVDEVLLFILILTNRSSYYKTCCKNTGKEMSVSLNLINVCGLWKYCNMYCWLDYSLVIIVWIYKTNYSHVTVHGTQRKRIIFIAANINNIQGITAVLAMSTERKDLFWEAFFFSPKVGTLENTEIKFMYHVIICLLPMHWCH